MSRVWALTGQNEMVAEWVASQPPFKPERGFGACTAIGWVKGDKLIAGSVYSNYDPTAAVIEISSAAIDPTWLTRDTINMMFSYPFDQLGCQMVVLRVSETNERMRRIANKFGFDEYRIPRLRGREVAECIYTFTDDQWLKSRFRSTNNG